MPRLCSVCVHPLRAQIDQDLLQHSQSYGGIARKYDLQDDALRRHEREHLRQSLRAVMSAKGINSAESLAGEVDALYTVTLDLLAQARAKNDLRLALLCLREARGALDLLFRMLVAERTRRQEDELTALLTQVEALEAQWQGKSVPAEAPAGAPRDVKPFRADWEGLFT